VFSAPAAGVEVDVAQVNVFADDHVWEALMSCQKVDVWVMSYGRLIASRAESGWFEASAGERIKHASRCDRALAERGIEASR